MCAVWGPVISPHRGTLSCVLLIGVEDGKFRVNDPNRRSNSEKLWDYDTLAPQIRNLWAYTLA